MNHNDLLAYLIVLDYEPVIRQLTPEEKSVGRNNLIGCLARLRDNLTEPELLHAIESRERLNVQLARGAPKLETETRKCAETVFAHLQGSHL